MPKSKSRRRSYQAPPKKKPKPSPRWYGAVILCLLFGGALIIVLNYLNLMPGPQAENVYLFVGLGMIALGFLGATQWR